MIIFFGPAGSGKSTQGRAIADKYGWRWLSVGQVLRDTGEFDEILEKGELVDDQEVVNLMNKQIDFARAEGMEIVLDGYPRDIEQANILLKESKAGGRDFFGEIEAAIILSVPKEELLNRIQERGRSDDNMDVVERRFEIFEQNIYSILPLLKERNVPIHEVDGLGSFEQVTERITKIVQDVIPAPVVWKDDQAEAIENDALEREKSYGE
ncbi:nucleoside monophosphate kinase [Candidatus Saccharibacteria bacterium]|nr:nucleoside monophosphate kinase [Candidatus Saccharibacteria bacterium]